MIADYPRKCNNSRDMSPAQTKFLSDFTDSAKLSAFRDFFLAAVGPSGRSVAFESSAGNLTVSSTSNRMLRKAEFSRHSWIFVALYLLKMNKNKFYRYI